MAIVTISLLLTACTTRAPTPPTPRPAPAQPLSPIHRDLALHETLWHLRAGLNVAALSCAAHVGPGVVTDYNRFLKAKQALLAQAYRALSADYRARGGTWQRALDTDMTRLYNHFASPPAQRDFCDAAATEVKRAITAPPDASWADALARLDRPFTAPPQLAGTMAARSPRAMPQAPPALPGGWRIQLGAFGSPAAARSAWADLAARSPELRALTPNFEPAPGTSLTRLQVKGVDSQASALRLCAHAAAAGFDCFPVKVA
jgi:cell division septation protein DedD